MPIHENMFAVITTALEHLDLSIHDARIYSTRSGYSLDSYFVLELDNKPLTASKENDARIINALHEELDNPDEFSNIVKQVWFLQNLIGCKTEISRLLPTIYM